MKTLRFYNYKNFAGEINDMYKSFDEDEKAIAIIAKYEEARQIIKALSCVGYTIRSIVSLEAPDFDNYYDEYIISITNIDEECEIWCEPLKRDDEYIDEESTVTYIFENCSSKIINHCNSDAIYEVQIGDFNEDDEFYYDDCDLNERLQCGSQVDFDMLDQDAMHGFTAEKSDDNSYMRYSLYTTVDLDKADIQDILKSVGF